MESSCIHMICGPVLFPDGNITQASLRLNNGRIFDIQPGIMPAADCYCDGIITPGMIDLQVNGGWGIDFTQDSTHLSKVARNLLQTGTTAFLPTIITSDFSNYPLRIEQVQRARKLQSSIAPNALVKPEAYILGIHLEGPYLNPLRSGAHPAKYIRPIDCVEIRQLVDPDIVRIFTFAPELAKGSEALNELSALGVVISMGHTDATYQEAKNAIQAGIVWGTHCFNGMRPLHQREPGVIGALLESSIPIGLIVDGIHVHPSLVKLAFRLKGASGITLVSDAMSALGMHPGRYHLGNEIVTVASQVAQLENGTMAGSLLTMDHAVRNMMVFTDCSFADALLMASQTPAKLLGIDHLYGRIASGYAANLVVWDKNLVPVMTIVNGQIAYKK
jgi:N-acetylglucosamine-6-phosphate deacetylase